MVRVELVECGVEPGIDVEMVDRIRGVAVVRGLRPCSRCCGEVS